MHIAGLTGGTGAGKSSAARRFETHGIGVVDADRIGHSLIAPGGDAVDDLVEAFGTKILSCGRVDRKALGALVFSDQAALATLNAVMQPRIALAIGRQCASYADAGHPACIVDAALLGDRGVLEPWVESLILVSCPEEVRVSRLVAGRGMAEELAWERIRAQVDPETKRALARWIIENDSTLDSLHQEVDGIAETLLADSGSSTHGKL